MTAIILLICCSLLVAVSFLVSFIWSVRNGQYDDTVTPSIRMLFDDTDRKDAQDQIIASDQSSDLTSHQSTTTKNRINRE